MSLSVSSIVGLSGLPSSGFGVRKWLVSQNIETVLRGKRFEFELADLPQEIRCAYLARCAAETGLPPGEYDDVAHSAFLQAPASMRAKAERKAAMACLLVSIREDAGWPDRIAIVRKQFGKAGTSKPSLKRLLSAVKGVDPINYAPALLPAYDPQTTSADVTDKAWSLFMTILRDAAPDFPVIQAWRDVRDFAVKRDWNWPTYVTVNRRWNALPEAQRRVARYGRFETLKQLAQPTHRDKTTIAPLEWVSLDGRTLDFWTDMGDGKPVRLTMLALVDVASNMVLDYELAASENAGGTVRLIKRTCQTYGIFDRLYTDNGSSFAGHLVAGGNVHRFRNAASKAKGIKPLGICFHLGITIHFALPGNAQAKIAERTFASLSRVIDDRPEFKDAHAGHSPGAAPNSKVVPVAFDTARAVIKREIARYNKEQGRRAQGAARRSYQQVFLEGIEARANPVRVATARQLYLASLIYSPVSVNRHGQIVRDTWIYGGPQSQAMLLPLYGTGKQILLGRDPDDLSAPAIAFDEDGRLICEGIEYVQRGKYDSVDGIRTAARNKKAARKATSEAVAANDYMVNTDLVEAMKLLDAQETTEMFPPSPARKVVGARFGAPLKEKPESLADPQDAIPAEYFRNMDAALANKKVGKRG